MQIQSASLLNVSSRPTNNQLSGFSIDSMLTSDDKALVSSVYGKDWQHQTDFNGGGKINSLASILAISRNMGSLKGPVTTDFFKPYLSNPDAGLSKYVLDKAFDYLSSSIKQKPSSSSRIDISA